MNNLVCVICGLQFEARRSDTKYCSDKCKTRQETMQRRARIRANRKPIIKSCLVCGDQFQTTIHNPYQIYCSSICLRQAMHKRSVETGKKKEQYHKHKEKYASIKRETDLKHKDKMRFSSNKKHVLERDGSKCVDCGSTKRLVIHHKDGSGKSENPNNEIDNLITLCHSCHMRHHSGVKNHAFIHLTKDQILDARRSSSSWEETAKKLSVTKQTLIKRRKMLGIF